MLLYPIGTTNACADACTYLSTQGYSFTDHPCPEITHLMLDVPSFLPDGLLRDKSSIEPILSMVPQNVTLIGGNLTVCSLDSYRKLDLLKDPQYLAKNAAITADCAVRLCSKDLERTFPDSPALVIGWGRIGKCLAGKLRALGCPVSIAARKEADRALAQALGYDALPIEAIPQRIDTWHLIFNTVPSPLPAFHIPQTCHAYELASTPGLPEGQYVRAKGLPGIMAPYSSGMLIAQTIIRLFKEEKS